MFHCSPTYKETLENPSEGFYSKCIFCRLIKAEKRGGLEFLGPGEGGAQPLGNWASFFQKVTSTAQEGRAICGCSHGPYLWMEGFTAQLRLPFCQSPPPSLTCIWSGDRNCQGSAGGLLRCILGFAFQCCCLRCVLTRIRIITGNSSNHPIGEHFSNA